MDPNILKNFNLPPIELERILKKIKQESSKAGKKLLIGDIIRFYLIDTQSELTLYLSNPNSSELKTFSPVFDDFLLEEEDECFAIYGYDFLTYHVLINSRTFDFCIQKNFKISSKPSLSEAEFTQKLFENFSEFHKSETFDLQHFASSFQKKSFKDLIQEAQLQKSDFETAHFEYSDDETLSVSVNQEKQIKTASDEYLRISNVIQFILRFFIDTGSKIDLNDKNWSYFFTFQQKSVAGFMCAYKFRLNSVDYKIRISQLIVFPPFQKQQLGSKLIERLYKIHLSCGNCKQITVEDPNQSFINLQFRFWVCTLIPLLKESEEFAKIDKSFEQKLFTSCKTLIGKRMKCNNSNSEILLDAFLLKKFKSLNLQDRFSEHLKTRICSKFQNEKQERDAKMKLKYLNFGGKVVSLAKIQKMYHEIESEDSNSEELVFENRLHFLESLQKLFC